MAEDKATENASSADMVAHAAAEASTPGADTESAYECPFCVMMRKGGCETVFKARHTIIERMQLLYQTAMGPSTSMHACSKSSCCIAQPAWT